MTSGVVLYNQGGIEGTLAMMNQALLRNDEIAHQIGQKYQILDEVSAGQASQSGQEFQAGMDNTRAKTRDLVQNVSNAVRQSQDGMNGLDGSFRNRLG
ncbi:hypothetical protein BKG82_26445 [Mycobacteroides chelonae]|uniref:Uncharacterized protein n=1 Tax=Mycobacteroides chelonae TaxID=1774 RepID=A0A1S1LCQ4_MYCCH|nr:hypothetical protein [Mycobacteroides chelonae]OHU47198.1 hypothetical protein BKG82_26445 [Mycobacteroides chelonae]